MITALKRNHLRKAKRLTENGDESSLRYACLETRQFMELVAYEKLKRYSDRLPDKVTRKWQPPQFFKALLEFEPQADRNYSLSISKENAKGNPTGKWIELGQHKTLRHSWLKKHYHKIGRYLHANQSCASFTAEEIENLKSYLESLFDTLESTASSSLLSNLAMTFNFECEQCSQPIVVNMESLSNDPRTVTCLNVHCQSEYSVVMTEEGQGTATLCATPFECAKCASTMWVEPKNIKIGLVFSCKTCSQKFQIITHDWGIMKL